MAAFTASEKRFIKIYREAQRELYKTITEKTVAGNVVDFQFQLLKQVEYQIAKLTKEANRWTNDEIPLEYQKHWNRAEYNRKQFFKKAKEKGIDLFSLSQEDIVSLNTKAIETLVNQKTGTLAMANAGLYENIKAVVTQKFAQGITVQEAKNKIIEELYVVKDAKGKIAVGGENWDITKYAEMFARTASREATNTVAVNEAKSVGSKIVAMSSHFPTCKICAMYQGRWFSIDPDYKEYPYIYDTAWKSGFNTVHPNCRHVFTTVILELEDADDIARQLAFSNRSFDSPGQSQKSLERYYAQQRQNVIDWNDVQQWNKMKARLGAENVPKTFSGFKRMKKAANKNWDSLNNSFKGAGQFSSSGGNIDIGQAKNKAGVEYFVKTKWGVQNVDFNGLDFQAIKPTIEKMDNVISKYPQLGNGYIKSIGSSTNAIASAGVRGNFDKVYLNFNKQYYAKKSTISNTYSKSVANNYFPSGTTWDTVGVHELGHALTNTIIQKKHNNVADMIDDFKNKKTAERIVLKAFKRQKKYTDIKQARLSISGYSAEANGKVELYSETIAEAFNDVITNGNKATDFSKLVFEELEKEL